MELHVSLADNASKKKPFFIKKTICKYDIYQILCQLKCIIIEENMDAVWNDVFQPWRGSFHDESVHDAIHDATYQTWLSLK